MPRRTKEAAERTRARILASALSLFSKKGYEQTTFNDIAARLKLTKGAVYWHFDSKEKLIEELVRLALEKFRRQIEALIPAGELTFPTVAEMMVRNAEQIVADPNGAAFFRLMKCQVKWGDDSMTAVRQNLLTNRQFGPKEAFKKAIANDAAAGRIHPTINAEEIATVVLAIWDGLVQARLDRFLECDLAATLRHAYHAIWNDIKTEGTRT